MSEPTLVFAVQSHRSQFVIPAEMIKKNIKSIQKQIERSKKQAAEEISRTKTNKVLTSEQKLLIVKQLVKSFEQLHKRLSLAIERDEDYRLRLTHRAQRLNELKNFVIALPSKSSSSNASASESESEVLDLHNEKLISWYREETNLTIVDFLLKSNVSPEMNLGLQLLTRLDESSSAPLSKLIDYDVFADYNRVFLSISEQHDLEAISAWYSDNRTTLKKIGSNLLFEIHYCKYLSLIEQGNPLGAIAYSKKNLAPYASKENYAAGEDPTYETNLRRLVQLGSPLVCISLLKPAACNSSRTQSRDFLIESLVSKLPSTSTKAIEMECHSQRFSQHHWRGLSECFTKDYTKVYGISKEYPLLVYLSAGLSSLKTKSCFCNQENTVFDAKEHNNIIENLDSNSLRDLALRGPNQYYKLLRKINQCPVCSPELYSLSRKLPFAQLITSIYNNPFKLPNGNIYPFDKLLNPSGKLERENLVHNGKVRDPLTHEIFFVDDCSRVFPA
ncbi:hypothetical protein HF325_004929 [Metschnikowia pulcherrima]|uniref:Protein fyv10 n=1 Tax=Metschnikowia pulcherrima TaxID=27326 RepID=A0A8H7LB66_9ASCO|nr:hypothetical protein HF325_004929 [Metschnikowia pulcherrima]